MMIQTNFVSLILSNKRPGWIELKRERERGGGEEEEEKKKPKKSEWISM